jgi:hypothetical protein
MWAPHAVLIGQCFLRLLRVAVRPRARTLPAFERRYKGSQFDVAAVLVMSVIRVERR